MRRLSGAKHRPNRRRCRWRGLIVVDAPALEKDLGRNGSASFSIVATALDGMLAIVNPSRERLHKKASVPQDAERYGLVSKTARRLLFRD